MSRSQREVFGIVLVVIAGALPACGSCAKDDGGKKGEPDPASTAEGTEPAGSAHHPRLHWDGGRHRFRRLGHPSDGGAPAASTSGEAPPP